MLTGSEYQLSGQGPSTQSAARHSRLPAPAPASRSPAQLQPQFAAAEPPDPVVPPRDHPLRPAQLPRPRTLTPSPAVRNPHPATRSGPRPDPISLTCPTSTCATPPTLPPTRSFCVCVNLSPGESGGGDRSSDIRLGLARRVWCARGIEEENEEQEKNKKVCVCSRNFSSAWLGNFSLQSRSLFSNRSGVASRSAGACRLSCPDIWRVGCSSSHGQIVHITRLQPAGAEQHDAIATSRQRPAPRCILYDNKIISDSLHSALCILPPHVSPHSSPPIPSPDPNASTPRCLRTPARIPTSLPLPLCIRRSADPLSSSTPHPDLFPTETLSHLLQILPTPTRLVTR
jgi:hypothetical protein